VATVNTQQAAYLITTDKDAAVPFAWQASAPLYTCALVTFTAGEPPFAHQPGMHGSCRPRAMSSTAWR
jgi:hypothetical protein